MPSQPPHSALVLRGLSKVFEGQRALDAVDFELQQGEVHALLGPNGSGKSTLIKILAGYHQPEDGAEAWLHGRPFELGAPAAARELRFIHQDLGLVEALDSVDNLALSGSYRGRWWLSDRRERRAARELLSSYGVDVDVTAPVHGLTQARQTMIAIVRALGEGLGPESVLVLDEPTAALPAREVQQLFDLVREVRRRGGSVIYVTHRLSEIFDIADRVTVLRDGRRVATLPTTELDHDKLVELIVGRALEAFYPQPPEVDPANHVLAVRDVAGEGVSGADITLHRGEIVGVSGLVGSGYEDLLHLIFGSRRRVRGTVDVEGRTVPPGSPHAAIKAGLAFAASDRKRLGGIADWTLRENVTLPAVHGRGRARWLSARTERDDAMTWLTKLGVVPAEPERRFAALSGGNQQKLAIARWLRRGATAYLLEEPTNGVDMGAKHAIYETLVAVARSGSGVLMTSQDPEELCSVCDRVLIMRDGAIAASLRGAELTEERIVAESVKRAAGVPERSAV